MLARIRKAREEEGFTLIELLVVMIIIGILAAIAIPLFLNQRKNAVDASLKSDLRTVANEMESFYTDQEQYPDKLAAGTVAQSVALSDTAGAKSGDIHVSKGNQVTISLDAAAASAVKYCILGQNAKATHNWVYISDQGGLQAPTVTACPAAYGTSIGGPLP